MQGPIGRKRMSQRFVICQRGCDAHGTCGSEQDPMGGGQAGASANAKEVEADQCK